MFVFSQVFLGYSQLFIYEMLFNFHFFAWFDRKGWLWGWLACSGGGPENPIRLDWFGVVNHLMVVGFFRRVFISLRSFVFFVFAPDGSIY